ncbi:MAG: glutaredoxin domain-containing protein [Brachybacterium tyrofermentans]
MNSEIVTIYTRPDCGPCFATKQALAKAGIAFVEVPLEDVSEEQRAAFLASGFMQAPVVLTPGGDAWAGFRPDRIKQQ